MQAFRMPYKRGFTLIELLIVVAIIAILAAVAVPNFLEAQTRSKVSRVKADMRSMGTALEAYCVDHNDYPDPPNGGNQTYIQYISILTTPLAYIASTNLLDPFTPTRFESHAASNPEWKGTYWYASYHGVWRSDLTGPWGRKGFVMCSFGPDRIQDVLEFYPYWFNHPDWGPVSDGVSGRTYHSPADLLYDPSNGTRSAGDVGRCGGSLNCPEQLGG